jgi:type IV pilus assembly protein PilW
MRLMREQGSRLRISGVTLIELMIAITVALILLAALAVMYGSSIQARNQLERTNRQIENGRYAIQLLRDDLQLAGFMGELNMRDGFPFPPPDLPDYCVTHLTAAAALPDDLITPSLVAGRNQVGDLVIDGLDYLAAGMTIYIQGEDDVDPADLPSCLTGAEVRANTDIVVVRRVMTCSTADAGCGFQANAPYLQASQCRADLNAGDRFRLRADASPAAFTLRPLGCTAGAIMPIRRFLTHIYFIANNNIAGDGIPTLKRRELTSTGFTTTALVEGIEDLQFEYGVSAGVDAAGAVLMPLGYVDLPADVNAWANARTVRVHLLSRATEPRAGYVDSNTYRLGSKTITEPGDAFTRQVFQTVVQLHNAEGRLRVAAVPTPTPAP